MKNEKVVKLHPAPPDADQLIVTLSVEQLRQLIREEVGAVKANGPQTTTDYLINATEAANLLHVSPRWLYKHADKLSYTVRVSETVVRFSHSKIQAEIQRKLKMQANGGR